MINIAILDFTNFPPWEDLKKEEISLLESTGT